MPDKIAFARWLDEERKGRGWSKSELARRSGKLPAVVSRWLSGERMPDASSCLGIANALGVHVDFVLSMAGHETRQRYPEGTNARQLAAMIPYIDWSRPGRFSAISGLFKMYLAEDEAGPEARHRPKVAPRPAGSE